MATKLKITENEKYTLQDVKYGKENKNRQVDQQIQIEDPEVNPPLWTLDF